MNKCVLRGSSWDYNPAYAHATFRSRSDLAFRNDSVGFRVVFESDIYMNKYVALGGGSWVIHFVLECATHRYKEILNFRGDTVGFRVIFT